MLGNFIAERRQSRQSRRTYCPRKVFDFAAAFGGVANNFVVCNRGQYIKLFFLVRNMLAVFGRGHLHSRFELPHKMQVAFVSAHLSYLCNGYIRCGKQIL